LLQTGFREALRVREGKANHDECGEKIDGLIVRTDASAIKSKRSAS